MYVVLTVTYLYKNKGEHVECGLKGVTSGAGVGGTMGVYQTDFQGQPSLSLYKIVKYTSVLESSYSLLSGTVCEFPSLLGDLYY